MPSRWDLLLDQKPIPIMEHLIEEAGKLLAKDFSRWPLPIEALDETGLQFEQAIAPGKPAPSLTAYCEAFRLARWELEREILAIDDYMRNRRYLEHGLAPEDRALIQLLSRYVVEQLLALSEATEGRVKRSQLLQILERIERNVVREKASASN